MATAQAQETDQIITLKGSTAIVTEFFYFSINSILYQRGIYPPESFVKQQKYGLTMMTTEDLGLKAYLDNVINQLQGWLIKGEVQRLVLVVTGTETGETLERWVFNVQTDKTVCVLTDATNEQIAPRKSQKAIFGEIQAIIRQITASVTFLPLLNEPCAFDMLVYADKEAEVPKLWEESDPKYITDCSEVRLRSFTTKVHKVEPMVAFKNSSDI